MIAGDQATPDDVERIRASLGLDRPYLARFGAWVYDIARGDLGVSIFTNLPVSHMIAQRIEPTLSLMIVTLILAVTIDRVVRWQRTSRHNRPARAAVAR